MPLYEVAEDELIPFRRLKGGADLYEREIEDLLWANVEEFTGETLFPIGRQVKLPTGGIPDVLALDRSGRVVIFEVKRDVDRHQIAQCLEYAGWARDTNLDELAGLYGHGPDVFWSAWSEYTETDTPVVVNPTPRLVLVARDFQSRTESALQFLIDAGVPVTLIRVIVYEDSDGRRFIDVEGEHEPTVVPTDLPKASVEHTKIEGRRIRVRDLVDYELLRGGDELEWVRPRNGERYEAVVTATGMIRLPDGREFTTPSTAAANCAGLNAYDGWYAWRVIRSGQLLNDLRHELQAVVEKTPQEDS